MNKLFLIGNGFDLAHGMKTSYTDFLLWYLNKTVRPAVERSNSFDSGLIKVNHSFNCLLNRFNTVEEYLWTLNDRNISVIGNNEFVQRLIDNISRYNWVDIEGEYYSQLVLLYQRLNTQTMGSIKPISEIVKEEVQELNNSFKQIKNELIEYLRTIKMPKEEIPDISSSIQKELINISDKSHVFFLNFNYTSTLDLYAFHPSHKLIHVNHIHGKLEDGEDSIVFGYGDEMDPNYTEIERLNENEYLKNMKSFSYFKTKNYQNLTSFIEMGDFEVFIMGHSCGLSDRLLLNSIFENKNCRKIKIYYYQKSKNENDFFEKTLDISRHFRPEYKNEMRNKIVPFEESVPLVKNAME